LIELYKSGDGNDLSLAERKRFMKLSLGERRRLMADQAEEAAPYYEMNEDWKELQGGDIVEA
jgi:hypothetical protein